MQLRSWSRRLLLPVVLVAQAAVVLLVVPIALIGALSAPIDRRLRLLRLTAMAASYICIEWIALARLLWIWVLRPLRGRDWWDRANVEVLGWALGAVIAMGRRTVGFRVEIDDAARPGPFEESDPVLVLARHGGIGDSFALVWLLVTCHQRRPRVVLKQVLRWEPLIDVALSRIGACFLPRRRDCASGGGAGGDGGGRLDARVGALADDLRDGDALLLFPEGGNWTPQRRVRAIRKLWASRRQTVARAAVLMDHVLPPRAGGVLACLDSRPEMAVVVVAHAGLDRITTFRQLWDAIPFEAAMSVRWWPSAHPPYGREERMEWLTTEWAVVDQWIDSRREAVGAGQMDCAARSGVRVSGRDR